MNFDTSPRLPIFAVPHVHPSENATEIAQRMKTIDSVRAAENVRLWNSYLPEDCVNTMIKMGWHRTA
jgi:hypothetical protein